MKTPSKCFIMLGVLAAIAIPVVGPFTFYGTVVPYLTPILPKPEGAPSDAKAGYNWKGPGLFWSWQRELSQGCANWSLAEDQWIAVYFSASPTGCDSGEPRFSFANFRDDHVDFGKGGRGQSNCSVHTAEISPAELAEARAFLDENMRVAKGDGELRMLRLGVAFLDSPAPGPDEHPCGDRYPNLIG